MVSNNIFHSTSSCIFLLILLLLGSCTRHQTGEGVESNSPILLRVGDFTVDSIQFSEKLKDWYEYDIPQEDVHTDLLDHFIGAGLLISKARELGYHKTELFKQQLAAEKQKIIADHFVEMRARKYKKPSKTIHKLIQKYPDKLIIDHIWVPRGHKDIYTEIFEKFEKRVDIDLLTQNEQAKKWQNAGTKYYKSKTIELGGLYLPLFEKVYSLHKDELLALKTQSGWHIVRLIHRDHATHTSYDNEKQKINTALSIATALEKGDVFADYEGLKNSVQLDIGTLKNIDFNIRPIYWGNKQADIVGSFKDCTVTSAQLINMLEPYPTNVKSAFNNKATRKQITTSLILKEMGAYPLSSQLKRRLPGYINHSFGNIPEPLQSYNDSVQFFVDKLEAYFTKYPNTDVTTMFYQDMLSQMDKSQFFKKKSNLLNPRLFAERKLLKLNYELLDSSQYDTSKLNDTAVLAFCSPEPITVKAFKEELLKLSPDTRIQLAKGPNRNKFVKHLIGNSSDSNEKIEVNHELLDKIDIIGTSLDSVRQYYSESQVIAKLNNLEITISGLKRLVNELPDNKRKDFLNPITLVEATKNLIANQYIFDGARGLVSEDEPVVVKLLNKKENQLLLACIYKHQIETGSLIDIETGIDELIQKSLISLMQIRLDSLLASTVKTNSLYINHNVAQSFNIQLNKSQFKESIKE